MRKWQRENTGVAFSDCTLGVVGVFLLDDGRHLAGSITDDAAIASRIVQLHGQQTQLLWRNLLEQTLKGLDFDQRYVTVKNQDGVGLNEWHCLSNRVASTQLFVLQDEIQIIGCQSLTYRVGTMADHHVDALWIKLPSAVDNMAKHRVAGNRMQNFRQCRTHASALAGSEDNNFKRHDRLPILGGQRLRPGYENRKRKKGSRGYPF